MTYFSSNEALYVRNAWQDGQRVGKLNLLEYPFFKKRMRFLFPKTLVVLIFFIKIKNLHETKIAVDRMFRHTGHFFLNLLHP